jgi:hypothetical protein
MKNINSAAIITVIIAVSTAVISCSKTKHYELSRFISPDTCGGCHDSIHEQWKGSMHQLSHEDIIYRTLAAEGLKGLTDKDEITEAEICVKCHTPVGFVSGYPKKLSDDESKIPDIAKEGIQCDFCHSITGAYKIFNAKLKLDPGHGDADPGVKRGPRKDSESDFHKSAYSDFHRRSELCGTCHDVRHEVFGTKLETTYEEWKNSPYNSKDDSKRITCQGCHMRQMPGTPSTGSTERPDNPGASAAGSIERPHVYTHYFVGANATLPQNKNQQKMAVERLKNAAVITIDDLQTDGTLAVKILNNGAGHSIPTGFAHMREVWLHIKVISAQGKTVYESGGLDMKNEIKSGGFVYRTVFGDGKGNPVDNLAKARELLNDNRLEPMKEKIETIKLTGLSTGKYTVKVTLNYRTGSPALLKPIIKRDVPLTVMASAEKTVLVK